MNLLYTESLHSNFTYRLVTNEFKFVCNYIQI